MDSFVVCNPEELALAWGSTPEALEEDVYEHSACGVLLKVSCSTIIASAAVGAERTRVRSLPFPFTMEEFEVLLRTVEQDFRAAMRWYGQTRYLQRWGGESSRKIQSQGLRKHCEEIVHCSLDDDPGDDIAGLWTIPDSVVKTKH